MNILMFSIIHHLKQHISLILIKIFRRRINYTINIPPLRGIRTVIVRTGVRAADNHDGGIALEKTEIPNWRLQQVTIFF